MLKKLILVLLYLNLWTPKPVKAEPVTIVVGGCCLIIGYLWGKSNGKAESQAKQAITEAAKDRIEADNKNKDKQIKELQAQLRRKIKQAEEDYQACQLENNQRSFWSSDVCKPYEEAMRSLREQSKKLSINS